MIPNSIPKHSDLSTLSQSKLLENHTPPPGFRLTGSGRVFSGCGIWKKHGAGFGKTWDILTGNGIWLQPGSGISKFGLGMRKLRRCWPWNLRISKTQLRFQQICLLSSTPNVANNKSELWKTAIRFNLLQVYSSGPPFVVNVILRLSLCLGNCYVSLNLEAVAILEIFLNFSLRGGFRIWKGWGCSWEILN